MLEATWKNVAEHVAGASDDLRHKVLFGSDFPVLTPDRWLADFATLDVKDSVRPLILKRTGWACSPARLNARAGVAARRGGDR